MSLSTYYLEYGRHLARLHRRRRRHRRRASNTASHEKINSWVSFSFLYEYGARLAVLRTAGAPLSLQSRSRTSHDLELARKLGQPRRC